MLVCLIFYLCRVMMCCLAEWQLMGALSSAKKNILVVVWKVTQKIKSLKKAKLNKFSFKQKMSFATTHCTTTIPIMRKENMRILLSPQTGLLVN